MSRKTVYLLCILFCLGACDKDHFSDFNTNILPPSGKTVPVNLVLDVAPLSSPPFAATRTDGNGSSIQTSFAGMEVELSGPAVINTRQLPDVNESEIHSVTILQFEGSTSSAVCVQARYIEAINNVVDLSNFSFKATQASISRIAVIANLNNNYISTSEWESGDKSYQDLLNLYFAKKEDVPTDSYPLYEDPNDFQNRALMFGMTDTKIETGKLVTVVLQRIFAKASFNIEIANELKEKYPRWEAQLVSLPGRCYLVPSGREKPFPPLNVLGDKGYYNSPTIKAANGVFNPNDLSAYLPINLQPDVPTATEQTRTSVAPQNSTYLQIIGLKPTSTGGAIQDQVIYQIHLGSNFTTNYTISPNTFYTYTIRIKGENPQDGTVVKFIPGHWGGQLQAYDDNGQIVAFNSEQAVKWQYEKEIEFYPFDLRKVGSATATDMSWGPKPDTHSTNSITDGRENTWEIHGTAPQATYEASYACYSLNTNITSKEELVWYQPSIAQLVGTYLVCSNLLSTLSTGYWSSTVYDANQAYYITKEGKVYYGLKDYPYYVRATKDLEPTNSN